MTSAPDFEWPVWDTECDVVIVGYGGDGAVTAIVASDNGAEVIVLEKQPADLTDGRGRVIEYRHTPNTRISAGIILNPTDADGGTRIRKQCQGLST